MSEILEPLTVLTPTSLIGITQLSRRLNRSVDGARQALERVGKVGEPDFFAIVGREAQPMWRLDRLETIAAAIQAQEATR